MISRVLAHALLLLLAGTGLTAQADTVYAKTRYPVVLVHGMSGFDSILGVDYFYRIPADLRANGAVVLVAEVSQFNDNHVRGEQLLKQMKQWAAAKGYKKFNLIAQQCQDEWVGRIRYRHDGSGGCAQRWAGASVFDALGKSHS